MARVTAYDVTIPPTEYQDLPVESHDDHECSLKSCPIDRIEFSDFIRPFEYAVAQKGGDGIESTFFEQVRVIEQSNIVLGHMAQDLGSDL
jgi:hypothetical protein